LRTMNLDDKDDPDAIRRAEEFLVKQKAAFDNFRMNEITPDAFEKLDLLSIPAVMTEVLLMIGFLSCPDGCRKPVFAGRQGTGESVVVGAGRIVSQVEIQDNRPIRNKRHFQVSGGAVGFLAVGFIPEGDEKSVLWTRTWGESQQYRLLRFGCELKGRLAVTPCRALPAVRIGNHHAVDLRETRNGTLNTVHRIRGKVSEPDLAAGTA
jgi:hypothetical protein